ncbi:hypothetical protein NT2_06_02560 [Caenibius tardaugens NBRC 16725]|uniref:NIPSNAP domain-containing protein n=1 Tax=Caenibius tardaugens NBRC 16725 TaxID=1219035 RepID=U2Y968_9SPHN|nr:hypothetical protein [Caenibius tardaugens]AZI37648.1 hypothetical protein EGO55_18110 [Caenibius tardaugens NBRC 16725]GAD49816.1 hypothetical protein NT2_06_02560 [Caenibius tardaugens NBRC 16725]
MESNETHYSRPDLARDKREIRLGTLLFTIVEARKGFEVAYNRWYERDHFYSGCMIGEYTLAGARYVATRACKALRYGSDADLIKGSFLALYWILDGHHADWDNWAVIQVNKLHAEGRMFKERDHVHTGLYQYEQEYNAPASTTPIELALDRPYAGVAAFIIDLAPGKSAADARAFFSALPCPGDVALLSSPLPLDERSPADVPDSSGDHVTLVSFSIENPADVWTSRYADIGERIEQAGLGRVRFASPFVATVPGTDTYMEEL